ncbi:MAG: hypothetical protein GY835_12465 [bacterium]|nr:hypothetical protein [bacterium]
MEDRLKNLFNEILATLREDIRRQGRDIDPMQYVDEEITRWQTAREDNNGVWFSLLLQMLRFGFPNYVYAHEKQKLLKEHLGDFTALAEMDEKAKKKLVEIEELGLNLQRVRSVCKNARTMTMLERDFGSAVELVQSFESEQDLADGIEEMFSYIKGPAGTEFTREMGWKKPGTSSGVRRVLSRMWDLVDGSIDVEGIENAINGMAKSVGKDPELIDFLLELFATGDDRIGLSPICDVNFACYRCQVSDELCQERRYEFGTAKEIKREEEE